MRDRLIEMIQDSVKGCARNWAEVIADYLLANGVIVPPCKVGDTVYRLKKRRGTWEVLPREVVSITHRLDHLYRLVWEVFSTEQDRLGSTAFLTREEAEKELERRKSNA